MKNRIETIELGENKCVFRYIFENNAFVCILQWHSTGEAIYSVLPVITIGGNKYIPSFRHGTPLTREFYASRLEKALTIFQERIERSSSISSCYSIAGLSRLSWNKEDDACVVYTSPTQIIINMKYKGNELSIKASDNKIIFEKDTLAKLLLDNGKKVLLAKMNLDLV